MSAELQFLLERIAKAKPPQSPCIQDVAASMAEFWYRMFWRECGSKELSVDQKVDALVKLTRFSLKHPYWAAGEDTVMEDGKTLSDIFQELIPAELCRKHQHLSKLTGLLLYAMHMEIANEVFTLAKEGKLTEPQIKRIQEATS
jgi:hypothetical protein